MRNRIKLFLPLVSAAIVCGGVAPMISCNKSDPKPTPDPTKPTEIKLTYDSGKTEDIEITYDKTLTFKCVVYPSTAEQDFVLVSSNRNVADFNGNILKPNPENLGGGDTNIYAKSVKYPGVVSNVIKVTVERRQSSLNIDYSKVDFNQKMTIGTDTSTYKFTDFNADFIFDDTYIVGNHTINAYAE
ncbi:MAG: hypothetical protein MJ200_01305 [Mycoplasmoidaceae bacterium]|nr:hypothetical protein [Mycoplasmoidaceae bacterium]